MPQDNNKQAFFALEWCRLNGTNWRNKTNKEDANAQKMREKCKKWHKVCT